MRNFILGAGIALIVLASGGLINIDELGGGVLLLIAWAVILVTDKIIDVEKSTQLDKEDADGKS